MKTGELDRLPIERSVREAVVLYGNRLRVVFLAAAVGIAPVFLLLLSDLLRDAFTSLTPAGQDVPDAANAVRVESVWDFVLKGGPMMIPIGLCALIAVTVIIERTISLRRASIIPSSFLVGLKKILGNGDHDRDEVLGYCAENNSPIARVFAAGIKKLGTSVEFVENHIQEAGQREVLKLRKYLRGLSVIASISPLLGLLGTIFGMITAFQTVAISAESLGKAELLATGIYQAMISTAAGLMVAIPVLVAYHWITAKIDRLVVEMDQMTVDFVEEYGLAPEGYEERGPKLRSVAPPDAHADDERKTTTAAAG